MERWTLNFLILLVNDVQCEISMLAILVLEEFITEENIDLLDNAQLESAQYFSKYLRAKKLLKKENIEQLSDQKIKQMFSPLSLYEWMHNYE